MKKEKRVKCERSPREKRQTILRWLVDMIIMTAAAAGYSLGVHCFISPNDIAPGGVTGIAIIVSEWAALKIGTLIFVLNVPLMILGFIFLGKATMIKTFISVSLITVFTDLLAEFMPTYNAAGGNGIMAAVFGGALMGVGLGLNYLRESTTGGADIIIKMIQKRSPDLKIGAITAVLDIFVVGLGMLVYRDINVVLFAVVTIFVQSKFIDFLVYGTQESRFLMVFSDNSQEISQRLLAQERGVTLFKAKGAYSGSEREVIATAVHRTAYSKVKRIIREVDPKAFVITTSAGEVLGEGFGRLA